MRKTIVATLSAAAVMAGLMSISATAATAAPELGVAGASDYPVTPFRLAYGASVLTGSITWHNRDVVITGELRARSSAKQGQFQAESANCLTPIETRTAQAGQDRPYRVAFDCNAPGGLTYVYVVLVEGETVLDGVICSRQGCA